MIFWIRVLVLLPQPFGPYIDPEYTNIDPGYTNSHKNSKDTQPPKKRIFLHLLLALGKRNKTPQKVVIPFCLIGDMKGLKMKKIGGLAFLCALHTPS